MNQCLKLFTLFLILITSPLQASALQSIIETEYSTPTLRKLWHDLNNDENAAMKYYDSLQQKHIIELIDQDSDYATVTYFAKGTEKTDFIMQSGGPDFYGLRFKRLGLSDIYFCVQRIPRDAWFIYGVNEFTKETVSGNNTLYKTGMRHIYDGAIIGPDAPLLDFKKLADALPKGKLSEVTINSRYMKGERKIQVYLPANYQPSQIHSLIIQLDGNRFSTHSVDQPVWRAWTPLPLVLESLINSNKIPPTIVVFVPNQGQRSKDLIDDAMADFIALELLPWTKDQFSISSSEKDIVISGPSRAGFTAMNTALRHPNKVASVLTQSGSFYYTRTEAQNWPIYPKFEGELLNRFKQTQLKHLKFYMDVGLYDLGLAAVGTNRQLRDILELKGFDVRYYEYNGGHAHLGWRHTIGKGIEELLGR